MEEHGMADLLTLAKNVDDEASFIAFICALGADWEDGQRKEAINHSSPYGPGPNGWENCSIGAFLEAAQAWGKASMDRPELDLAVGNPWCRAAQILYAGKSYE
jgi:hypothetical protein